MKYKALLLFFALSVVYSSFGQQGVLFSPLLPKTSEKSLLNAQANYNLQPWNGAAFMNQWLAQQNFSYAAGYQSHRQGIPAMTQMKEKQNPNSPDFAPVLKIPVIVHVIYDPADPIGTGTNLSIDQIQSQIDKLNEVYRLNNANFANTPLGFQAAAGDAEIEFCLANVTPAGAATNGIDRQQYSTASIVDLNYIENVIKPATYWNPSNYLNIWTVAVPNTTPMGGIQGYAYYPVSGFAGVNPLDGVVSDYRFFGVGYNAQGLGISTVREVGHYLGLPDIWGQTTNSGMPVGCTSDDGIPDTPEQAAPTGMTHPSCPTTIPVSCGSNDMYVNFMDYMKDQSCQSMFTNDQITVMRAVLTGLAGSVGYGDRSSLLVSSAAACTSPCAIALTTTTTNESCGGLMNGSATATATGGTPPYLFTWNTTPTQNGGTISGLAAGDYQVTVSDFTGCQQVATVTVNSASTISATFTVTNESCNGNDGIAVINPTGGTAPYNVVWGTTPLPQLGNTAIGLKEGIYGVQVTDAVGCTYTDYTIVYDNCNEECDTLAGDLSSITPTVYFNPYNGGFISGTNGFGDKAKADYFDYQGTNTHVKGGYFAFALANAGTPTSSIEIAVWDGTGGTPGAELGAKAVSMQTINANIAQFTTTYVDFDAPIAVNGEFFIGFKIPNPANGDTVAIITNALGQADGFGRAWEQWADGTWHDYISSWGVELGHGVAPVLVTPPQASFSPTNITACDSQTVTLTNFSINGSDFEWMLPGADTLSPVAASPSVSYTMAGSYDATLITFNGCMSDTLFAPGAITINSCPSACDLYATLTATSVSCNGGNNGTVTVTPNSGTGPYNILWSTNSTNPTVTGLTAGNYMVTVTDATGCSVVGDVSVGEPDVLALTTNTTDETCANNDGSANVAVTGGVAPYSFAWNTSPQITADTAYNLTGGVYSVTVTDANGCTAVASATVTDACTGCAMSLSSATVSPLCNGDANGEITITPALGTYPYAYDWTSATPSTDSIGTSLMAGVYQITVTDALNCVDSITVVLTQPDLLEVFLAATPETCTNNDGTATLSATGGVGPYFFAWNTTPIQTTNQITGLAAGTYQGGVIDLNGCIAVDSIMVTDACPCGDTLTLSSTPTTCVGGDGSATVMVQGAGSFSYQWSTAANDTLSTVTGLDFGIYTVTVTSSTGCVSVGTVTVDDGCNCGMVLTTSSTGESCLIAGSGTATVEVSGIAQAPYSFLWNTSPAQTTKTVIGLSQGTYTVTVTDATGCSQTAMVDVEGKIMANVSVINASCGQNNGKVTAVVTGGDGDYTYLWNLGGSAGTTQTITGLAAGSYPLYVTDGNGCTASATAVVVQNGTFNVTTAGVDNFCSTAGASVNAVAVGGGTPPFSFQWNTPNANTTQTVNNLATGFYNVTVTDVNGCAANNSVTVTSLNAGPTLAVSSTNVSCFGDSDGAVDLSINANTAVAISWSNGINSEDLANLTAGDYTVVVVDANGCIASTTVAVSQPSPIVITGISTPTILNDGTASATVSGGTPPYTYAWNNGGTTQTITNLISGTYTLTVTDNNNCTSTGAIVVQQFTGTLDLKELTLFNLYPNPTSGYFNVELEFTAQEAYEVAIFNAIGQQVFSYNDENTQTKLPIDLSNQASGVYFVVVTTDKGRAVQRLLLNN